MAEEDIEKLKRIKAERAKAEKALEKDVEKEKRINSAYLEMDSSSVRGYTRDPTVTMHRAEKNADIGLILAAIGLVFAFLTLAATLVSVVNNLGLAGAALTGILGAAEYIGFGVGLFLAAASLSVSIYCRIKFGRDIKRVVITSGTTILIVIGYFFLYYLINRFA